MATSVCAGCGQLIGVEEYDLVLWDVYERIRDGRSSRHPLVYSSEYLAENVLDEDDHAIVIHSMEKNMVERGLCPCCGRPDLRNVKDEDIMSEEEAVEAWQIEAEQAAERRVGA